ncbi:MAG: 30S ribosomal protein S6 [Clostridia bacterium]|nr:30S ribosomal protein S6 [Clostridia bacterium]
MNSYETLFIVNPNLSEEDTKNVIDKFVGIIGEHGTAAEVNEWGKRKLAYPINDLNEGYYVLVDFEADPALPAELERRFGIDENILRSIVVRHAEKKTAE